MSMWNLKVPNSEPESKALLLALVVRRGLQGILDKCKASLQLDQEVWEINVHLHDYGQYYPVHLKFAPRADFLRGAKCAKQLVMLIHT